jgi:type I restriction enzyme, S subunit
VSTIKLSDCAAFFSGGTPDKGKPEYWQGTIPWFSPKDIKSFDLTSAQDSISEVAVINSATRIVDAGAILIVARSGILAHTLPVGVVRQRSAFNQDIKAIVPSNGYDTEFLALWLRANQSRVIEDGVKRGPTVHSLVANFVEELEVPRLSIHAQRQMAARLKAQLTEVNHARQAAQEMAREATALRRSLVRSAFDKLLTRYGRDTCLKDVCSVSAGGTPSRDNAAFFKGDIPWVKTLDLNFGIVTETEERISREAFNAIRGEMLPVGTVLLAMYGGAGTIGKTGILGIKACTNQAVCALQPKPNELDPTFLHEWLCYMRKEWMRHSGGNRKDPNINKSVVENMTLPLPSLTEQRMFAPRLKGQLAEAEVIAAAANQQLSEIDGLSQRLLTEAFHH